MLSFIVSQGFIVFSARAIPAWNVSIMPFFFVSSSFASGAGVALILAASERLLISYSLVLFSLIFAIINLVIWFFYLRCSSATDFQSATMPLRRPSMMFFTIVFGHAFSILILFLFQIRSHIGMESSFPYTLITISGLAIIIGVAAQKAGVVLSAGYTRKIVL